ncbi:uncharacterized protein Z518_06049 [Rhinocladiella mackenziei CBS 650.93]|uniref:Amine oxidase domain-containing protein n=1 Tax=Rhinocladiella mackenziei CBS 650.93 TaxID=1442369 RepID=A0A0D2FSS6_9EURO|nr:uncharacterized protein Z518_06049 [Rhinocladiella mackenziei CBS 650.93]KIX05177.1 hypothetical protein Z518_06049 [Rhinocladiella mackenziei CBS 650.93]
MKASSVALTGLLVAGLALTSPIQLDSEVVHFRGPFEVNSESVHNIHVEFDESWEGELRLVHGECDLEDARHSHHEIAVTAVQRDCFPDRFVWIVPSDAIPHGCIHAFSGSALVGRSNPITVSKSLRKRQSIADVADTSGPWFDGVAFMQSKNVTAAFVAEAKNQKIAIVGGGMSGLMTSLLLQSVGITNWHIIESSHRVGGRVRTRYLNHTRPDQYQYQEMGPMRFPVSIRYPDTNETLEIQDHKMVFQLADVLNKMNSNDHPELAVNFIPWIQSSPNVPANSRGYRLPNGRIPSSAQIEANSSLSNPAPAAHDPEAAETAEEALEEFVDVDDEKIREAATNVYQAHKQAIEDGLFYWSEANYIRYFLGMDANTTDYVAGSAYSPMWGEIYDTVYFSATSWRTIDKGLSSLPRAFMPHIANKTTLGRKVEGMSWNNSTGKIAVNWRGDPLAMEPESEEYDYAVVAVPFSKVRLWRTPPYSSLLTRAISSMNYQQSCKVALHYETRFWEHMDPPIIGGCGSTDIPGIGSVCYPSYNINASGPGVILASYSSGTSARSLAALSDKDHVGLVQRAMVEVHGEIAAEQFTGVYDRQCWEVDEHQAGAWASPFLGQQELYLPAYYNTEFNTIFVGEHTSYTHAWIFSALDSAVRGTTQLLLELGLVDEAKGIVDTWMGRWISI